MAKLSENLPGFIYTYQLFPDGKSCFPFSSKLIEEIYEVTSEEVSDADSKAAPVESVGTALEVEKEVAREEPASKSNQPEE